MRLTCLKCGHQFELATGPHSSRIPCVCGQDYSYPEVLNTGIQPSEAAAERSRSRAFRAAGLVKNIGGFAFGIAALGVLFFPLGLVGAVIGVYVITMLRGAVGRYSGRKQAAAAVVIGISVFMVEGSLVMRYFKEKQRERLESLQVAADDDLRALLRTERMFRADNDTYGTFKEFRFTPRQGKYTLYLGPDDYIAAKRDGEKVVDPLPAGIVAAVSESAFTAVAVANLDGDPSLDVWTINDHGAITHVMDDIDNTLTPGVATPGEPSLDGGKATAAPETKATGGEVVFDLKDEPSGNEEKNPLRQPEKPAAATPTVPSASVPKRSVAPPPPREPVAADETEGFLTIEVSATPDCHGGRLAVDGVDIGKYPVRRQRISPGQHTLQITSEGDCAGRGAAEVNIVVGRERVLSASDFK